MAEMEDEHSAIQLPQDLSKSYGLLRPHSDLTFKTFDALTVEEADLRQSLLTGSLLRQSSWIRVAFTRSDIDGARIEKCSFTECDFANCDLRSAYFIGNTFASCRFNEAFVHDCKFDKCAFIDCSFEGSSVTQCALTDSRLERCTLDRATFLHNRFVNCGIVQMTLGNCTFLYSFMSDCTFTGVTINADSIGAIFGLTPLQIDDLSIMFLGKQESPPDSTDIVPLLMSEYSRRQWYLYCLVLTLNCRLAASLFAVRAYLDGVRARYFDLGFAKGDELEFFEQILEELARQNRLPLLTLNEVVQWCIDLQAEFASRGNSLTPDRALGVLSSAARLLYYAQVERLEVLVTPPDTCDLQEIVHLSVTFNRKPNPLLHELLVSIQGASGLRYGRLPEFIGDASGSYTEFISTTLLSVVALQVFLFLVNGCIIQLTELKHRLRVFAGKQPDRAYSEMALLPTQKTSPLLLSALQGLTHYAKGLDLLKTGSPSRNRKLQSNDSQRSSI